MTPVIDTVQLDQALVFSGCGLVFGFVGSDDLVRRLNVLESIVPSLCDLCLTQLQQTNWFYFVGRIFVCFWGFFLD